MKIEVIKHKNSDKNYIFCDDKFALCVLQSASRIGGTFQSDTNHICVYKDGNMLVEKVGNYTIIETCEDVYDALKSHALATHLHLRFPCPFTLEDIEQNKAYLRKFKNSHEVFKPKSKESLRMFIFKSKLINLYFSAKGFLKKLLRIS